MKRLSALLASAILFCTACGSSTPSSPGNSPSAAPSATTAASPTGTTSPGPTGLAGIEVAKADMARLAADPGRAVLAATTVNAFGLDLYARLAATPGNLVVSPASLAIALSMARAGARGVTATEMDAVLHDLGSDADAEAVNALDAALTARSGPFPDASGADQDVSLRIANALFAQRGMTLEPGFLETMAGRFGAGVKIVDYVADTEAARLAINNWVADNTEDRIPEILGPADLSSATRLALANAIYLKAAWLTPFPEDRTQAAPFTLSDGSTVQVPTMHTAEHLPYADGTGWAAVELPYVGNELAMLVIVPDDMASFEATFDSTRLTGIVATLRTSLVDLALPRFDIESRFDLVDRLAALGMTTAFGSAADFGGITTDERLHISRVIHQADMTVDEAGTEAAAATIIVMGDITGPPGEQVELRVDHPFIVVLRDRPTGAAVFVARVEDPSATR